MSAHIAVVPGSARRDSLNRRLAGDLAARFAERDQTAVVVELGDYPLPIYHGDDEVESGVPDAAIALHGVLAQADGVVLVSPEYNGGMPALLKNSIDWVTRVERAVFHRWLIGLVATSPGSRGGANVLRAMRHVVDHMRLEVLPTSLSVPHGGEAFDEPVDTTSPARLARPDVVAATDAFVDEYVTALADWVGRRDLAD